MHTEIFLRLRLVVVFTLLFNFLSNAQTGNLLKSSMIWHSSTAAKSVGFRKQFQVSDTTGKTTLFIFADNRYVLWINGRYVMRGPCRFDPKRVEYDNLDVKPFLVPGSNLIAVHVYGHVSNGKSIKHNPGLALRLEGNGFNVITDASWNCSDKTRFGDPSVNWPDVMDRVDATIENGDFTTNSFNDGAWAKAVKIDGNAWGSFHPRMTPLLRATENTSISIDHTLPYDLPKGTLKISMPRCMLGYVILDFDADAGSQLLIGDRHTYKARAGRQTYMTLDAFGFGSPNDPGTGYVNIQLQSGKMRLHGVKVYNWVYPFTLTAKFQSNDNYLNRLWDVGTWSIMQNSEDGYIDCPWERAEWLGDAAVVEYPITRACFSGPLDNDKLLHGDPRLYGSILRHIALSSQSDGRLKAHAPSDRFDIHGYIEDYSCLWVQGVRQYFEHTGDTAFVRDVWPALTGQMKWFMDRVESDGLVKAREFIIFDNPLKYKVCKGATVNAFVYKALRDAQYLAGVLGKTSEAAAFNTNGNALYTAFNKVLWNNTTYKASTEDQPTMHASVLALNRGIVPADREASVRAWVLSNYAKGSIQFSYTHFWLLEELYKINTNQTDSIALNLISTRWNNKWNATNPGFVTSESMGGGRNYHNFGAVPVYFLSAYMLGARQDGPIWNKRIFIEPRLGNLKNLKGTAVTENGLVNVSWVKDSDSTLEFSFSVPNGASARVGIPLVTKNSPTLVLNKKVYVSKGKASEKGVTISDRFIYIDTVVAGNHTGRLQPGSLPVKCIPVNDADPTSGDLGVKVIRSGKEIVITFPAKTYRRDAVTVDIFTTQGRMVRSFNEIVDMERIIKIDENGCIPLKAGNYLGRVRVMGFERTFKMAVLR